MTVPIRKEIADLLVNLEETEQSKIFDNREFGYYKVTVERPLRLSIDLSEDNLKKFEVVCQESNDQGLMPILRAVAERFDYQVVTDYNQFSDVLSEVAKSMDKKLAAKRAKLIKNNMAFVDEQANKVIKKIHNATKTPANSLHGLFGHGKNEVVEYEPDSNLRDTEQIPLLHEGGIEAFFKYEVLTYAPDAWIDESKTQIGYEISFTKYFYKPVALRSLDEIIADIKALEAETDGLLHEIIRGLRR